MDARQQKKWNQLDKDGNGYLEGDEVLALAEWVYSSFRPGQSITPERREEEARKILKRCDLDGDGRVDKEEFQKYYDTISAQMTKFHRGKAEKAAKEAEKKQKETERKKNEARANRKKK